MRKALLCATPKAVWLGRQPHGLLSSFHRVDLVSELCSAWKCLACTEGAGVRASQKEQVSTVSASYAVAMAPGTASAQVQQAKLVRHAWTVPLDGASCQAAVQHLRVVATFPTMAFVESANAAGTAGALSLRLQKRQRSEVEELCRTHPS